MRLLRTPLAHFVLGGAALFWLVHGAALIGTERRAPVPVVLSAADVARLRADYARETGLEPTEADESALVERSIEEELLFREAVARGLERNDRSVRNWLLEQMRALGDGGDGEPERLLATAHALGLDRTDLVVRRILVQKMRLLAARADEQMPGENELRAFYAERCSEYRAPGRVSFWHVFLSAATRGASVGAEAQARLEALRRTAVAPDAASRAGDAFSVPPHLVAQSEAQLEKLFGGDFAAAIGHAEPATWLGPFASPYGLHLVWVEARDAGTAPEFEAVRGRVLERWLDERRAQRVAGLLRELKQRTPLEVESSAWRRRSVS